MANSTFKDTVNRVLYHAGQAPITDNAKFNNNDLEKVQLQAKLFVDKVNRRLVRMMRGRWLERKDTFNTADGDNSYDLDADQTLEGIVEDSFFDTTNGTQLKHMTYQEWREKYPEGTTQEGYPQYWFVYTPDGTNIEKIGFDPIPSGTYTIEFRYFPVPTVLSNYDTTIQWPTYVEDIVWDYAQFYLEAALSEGKAAEIATLLETMYSEIRQVSRGYIGNPSKVDLGIKVRPMGQRGLKARRAPL